MIISIIAAMDENKAIGFQGKIPWMLKTDLKRFKRITMGHHLIMGRKTYESIGRPLPGRKSIVISKSFQTPIPDLKIVKNLNEGLSAAIAAEEEEVFIIGGNQVFADAIVHAQRMYLTIVHIEVNADVYFPSFNPIEWRVNQHCYYPADENNQYPSEFKCYEKG